MKPDSAPAESHIGRADPVASLLGCSDASARGAHAAQALNVWTTAVLYGLSAVIMGAMLALDSPRIALIVFGPLVVGLWLVMLTYLVRAATAASQGLPYTIPRWLCSAIVR